MVKQLANASNEKLQSAFMLILRHIVEDEATIRQIMTAEIVGNFESKPSRQIDAAGYVRQMYHLVLRNPEIFVEVSNEKLRLVRYDAGHRTQALALKEDRNARQRQDKEDKTQEPSAAEASSTAEDKEKEKDKAAEMKPPVVENPDGVIHYLLSELLSYKDVDDKETPTAESTEQPAQDQAELPTDIEMSMDEPTPSVTSSADAQTSRAPKKGEKPSFDAKDHPIYIYRCFLLQCLTELLGSYTRAKVEFINFSRKADPLASTPSKPRSGILNYMLNALVPLGTMEHDESLAFKKRNITSSWTMQALVALCTKTYELPGRRRNEPKPTEEDEPEVAFVRRFVLEHALRSFKEANASTEPLDVKYSKLMSLADLFDKMLSGYSFSQDAGFPNSARQIAKAMFEKHFIPALTASVAEIDLNFPSSKRVIKYILRPINKLTQTAVMLSDNGEISTASSGETEDDEISSATSVSDMEDEREETPDLFRHSTLGMLEPRHEEETSSEESEGEDDEMYDDEYDDEMDYDEDVPEDDGEVVSDEEDMGPIEGLPGDAVEVIIDDEDDEDDDDEDDDDDDDLDDHSEMEEDDDIYAGEITGDRDNESLDDGEDDEWESDEITEDEEEAEMMNQFEDELADMRQANRSGDAHNRIDELFRALNQATGDDDLHDHGLGGDIHDEILDDLNEEGGASLSRSFLHPLFANPRNVEEDEMDELEEEADDYDEYDMDHGSEGDMEGKTNTIICLVLNV
jgi:E3 ubiquitin-protein ligase HUWE1